MVELRYVGHLGNNLFEYALARILAEELGHALTCSITDPRSAWGVVERSAGVVDRLPAHVDAFEDARPELPGRRVEGPSLRWVAREKIGWNGHGINVAYALDRGRDRRVVLEGYFQRIELYHPHRARIRRWLRLRPVTLPVELGPRDVVVHARRSLDVRMLDRLLSVDYYRDAVERLRPARVFVCGTGIDAALRRALQPFGPTYLPELDAVRSLALLAAASRIVMANSTFSWWGAYLSEAERVVFPLPERGLWSADRPEVDLRVPEERFEYVHDAPLEPWRPMRRHGAKALSTGDIDADARPLAAWVAGQTEAFGPLDLAEAGFGAIKAPWRALLVRALREGALVEVDRAPGDPPLADLFASGVPFGLG